MTRFKALPRSRQIIVGIVAAAILGCCGIAGLAAILPGDDEPTRSQAVLESTATNQPASTSVPSTDTPIPPTDTLIPPTETPPPTDTPVPTDTPEPSNTPQPTATQGPTNTPRPTKTPAPPTDTPIPPTNAPTNTPAPTPTPAPTKEPKPNVIIASVYNNSYDEHVTISNTGDGPANLSGWTVSGSKGDETYRYPEGYILPAGASMRLFSGDNGIHDPPSDIYWTDKTVWNNSGETVFLRDAAGNLVDDFTW